MPRVKNAAVRNVQGKVTPQPYSLKVILLLLVYCERIGSNKRTGAGKDIEIGPCGGFLLQPTPSRETKAEGIKSKPM